MIAPAEDAVKEVDKNWTRDEIAKKIGELKIPGDFQQSINGLGAKVARIEGQLSVPTRPPHPWITPLIAVAGTAFVAFQAWMGVTTYQHGTKLSGMQTALLQIGITIAANTPADPKSQAEAKVALAEARKNPSKPLSKQTVEQAGSKFVEASPGDQNTWNVALEFAEYQSSQNTGLVPKAADKKTPTNYGGGNFFEGFELPGKQRPAIFTSGYVPYDDRAKMEAWGIHQGNPPQRGPEYIFLVGGAYGLDDTILRRVFFQNVEVIYHGGQIDLDHVVFAGCRLVFDDTPNARAIINAILTSGSVTLKLPKDNNNPTHF